jgi:diacylglycerol kinase (ATP)
LCAEKIKQALVVYSPACANPSYLDEVLGYVARRLCDSEMINVRIVPLHENSIACLLFNYEPLDLIVVAGGDKTVRCVLESLAQTKLKVPVGLIPLGSDTLLAAKLGIKPCHEREDIEEAVKVIAAGNTVAMDLGRINGRYFAIDAVIGNIPPVVLAPESNISRNFGVLSHLTPFVQSMGKRSLLCRILFESEGFYRLASSIFITNARGVGASQNPGGLADGNGSAFGNTNGTGGSSTGIEDLSDGSLYLCIVNPLSLGDYGRLAYRFGAWYLSGTVSGDAPLLIKKIRQVRIETDREAPLMIDGEIWGTTPVEIEVVPGAVNVIVPPPKQTAVTSLEQTEENRPRTNSTADTESAIGRSEAQ